MMMKLGAEFELKDAEIRASTLKSREIFLRLLPELKPEAVNDLMRLFNIDSLPKYVLEDMDLMVFFTKLFFLHTKRRDIYSIDLGKTEIQADVRNTPVLAYFEFIFKNQRKFDRLLKKSEIKWKKFTQYPSQDLITQTAIDELIPDWNTFKSKYKKERIYIELYRWAEKWNLTNDWCLDFALECLKNFKVNLIDKFRFPDNYLENKESGSIWYLNEYRYQGKAWREALFELIIQGIHISNEIPDCPKFTYEWEIKTEKQTGQSIIAFQEYYNPLLMAAEKFRKRARENFWVQLTEYLSRHRFAFAKNHTLLVNKLNKFDKAVENHIQHINASMKPFAQKTPEKKEGDKHFRWLIEYQIPPIKNAEDIGKKHNMSSDNIRKAIRVTSSLLGLTLRRSIRPGRPRGVKETRERRNYSSW